MNVTREANIMRKWVDRRNASPKPWGAGDLRAAIVKRWPHFNNEVVDLIFAKAWAKRAAHVGSDVVQTPSPAVVSKTQSTELPESHHRPSRHN